MRKRMKKTPNIYTTSGQRRREKEIKLFISIKAAVYTIIFIIFILCLYFGHKKYEYKLFKDYETYKIPTQIK